MEKEKTTIFDMESMKAGGKVLKGKAPLIKDIVKKYTVGQIEDPRTFLIAGGIGLYQGLKYKGSFKLGVKAGLSTVGVMIGVNVVNGVIEHIDEIRKA